ncbi:MFS transporter [Arthrobacter sp. NA-172]|uniref:MFS transporter n=1 Tax=Arthrobacter sp. NA-172 TaxID=3367524 RepID=UPI00375433CD
MTTSAVKAPNHADRSTADAPGPVPPPGRWRNPGFGFLAIFALAVVAVSGALISNAVLMLALKAAEIDPANGTTVLSIAVGVGSIASLVAAPVIGRFSDRTVSRLGRRRPYLVAGSLLLALGAVLTVTATSTMGLTLAFVATSVGAVAALSACSAIIPDQYQPSRRGTPSAVIGLGSPIGALLGLFLAQSVEPNLTAMVLLPAGLAVVATLALAFIMKDRLLGRGDRPHFARKDFFGTFWVNPRKNPSYAWVWWSRFLIFFGIASVNAYQAFYLIMSLHIAPETVGSSIFLSSLIGTGSSMLFAPFAVKFSNKVGRRKPFVIAAAMIFASGLVLVALAPSFTAFLLAVAVIGLGQGVYLAVDFALVTQVLPNPEHTAKDLGIMNLANSLPTSIVPAIAPALLALGASAANPQNFTSLFGAGAVAGLIGALLILPIRKVK